MCICICGSFSMCSRRFAPIINVYLGQCFVLVLCFKSPANFREFSNNNMLFQARMNWFLAHGSLFFSNLLHYVFKVK